MNTTKIAASFPYFLDAINQLSTGRSMADMMSVVQQALFIKANTGNSSLWVTLRDQDNPVLRFNELGMPTDEVVREMVPARVFAWVCRQQPAAPTYNDDLEGRLAQCEAWEKENNGWQVKASEVLPQPMGVSGQLVPPTTGKGRSAVWAGSEQELAVVLRGVRAFQAKRRKQTRKLIAQLWAYYLSQPTRQYQLVAVATEVAEGRIAA
ncbi:MAG: hypothetical protein EOO60_04285 [Hymenobacter sp.]|nr:MAG: hypothetical protein EOO60_04285 [Hymenobacter sp.]